MTSGDWGLLDPAGISSFDLTSDDAVLTAMVDVERAILRAWGAEDQADPGVRPGESTRDAGSVTDAASVDRDTLRSGVVRDGVAVVALVGELRAQLENSGAAADRLHAGATSQDILDSALVLVARDALGRARDDLAEAGTRLAGAADRYRSALRLATTLGRSAAPSTLGILFAGWLDSISSAIEALDRLRYPVQYAGPVGDGEQADRLARRIGASRDLRARIAEILDLTDPKRSWQTDRTPILEIAFGAATVCASAGRIGRDLTAVSRDGSSEVELTGGGGSSAMAHKRNPVDAIGMTTAGLQAPGLLATITASAVFADERPAGEWHAAWGPFRQLVRLAESAAAGANRAVTGMTTRPEASLAALDGASAIARSDADTLDAAGPIVDAALTRFADISGREVRP
ncbi:MAG: lyase family protein [Mycetocola sp.]